MSCSTVTTDWKSNRWSILIVHNDTLSHHCTIQSVRTYCTIYATVTAVNGSPSILVDTHRRISFATAAESTIIALPRIILMPWVLLSGITTAATIRRKPNCFNLLHQMKLLKTFGGDSQVEHFVEVTWYMKLNWANSMFVALSLSGFYLRLGKQLGILLQLMGLGGQSPMQRSIYWMVLILLLCPSSPSM